MLGLIGDLGAGKTTLVQGLVGALGAKDAASSPSYALLNTYEAEPRVLHADLWRLQSADELETTGYWDYVDDGRWLMCVEWINRVPSAWPGDGALLSLSRPEHGRLATLWASDASLAERLRVALAEPQ